MKTNQANMQYIFSKSFEEITLEDIESLISNGVDENQHLDYKWNISEEFVKDVAGFANTEGGLIIFGIKENQRTDGSKIPVIEGTENTRGRTKVEEFLINTISQKIYPVPKIKGPLKISLPNDDKSLWLLDIPRSYDKPHIMSSEGRFYVRYGSSSIPATRIQVEQMFNSSKQNKIDFIQLLSSRKLNVNEKDFLDDYYSRQIRNIFRLRDKSLRLCNQTPIVDTEVPLFNISMIPFFDFDKDRIDTSKTETIRNLEKKIKDYNLPYPEIYLLHDTGYYNHDIDNCCFHHHITLQRDNLVEKHLRDFIRIYNNGHIETCLSSDIFIHYEGQPLSVVLTPMLVFIEKFFECGLNILREAEYFDRIYVQISFKNIRDYIIRSFFKDQHEPKIYQAKGIDTTLSNKQRSKYIIENYFDLAEFRENKQEILLKIERKILLLFGQNVSLAFDQGNLNLDRIAHYNWLRAGQPGEICINLPKID